MMKVRLLRNTVVGGKAHEAGEVVDASEADARLLFGLGKAVLFEEVERAVVEPVETAVAAPQRKRRRRKVMPK